MTYKLDKVVNFIYYLIPSILVTCLQGNSLSRGFRSLLPRLVYKPRFLFQLSSSFSVPLYTEEDVTIALNALVNGEYKSIRKAAISFQIPPSTLRDRQRKIIIKNRKSRQSTITNSDRGINTRELDLPCREVRSPGHASVSQNFGF